MSYLEDQFQLAFHELQQHYKQVKSLKLLLAVSGGPDSMVLLDILWRHCSDWPGLQLFVVHVNHAISPNATSWQQLVEARCQTLGVPCFSETVELNSSGNFEANARQARYEVFQAALKQISMDDLPLTDSAQASGNSHPPRIQQSVLVLGHNANDMAEHFLFRAMRAAGPQGLSGPMTLEQHFTGWPVWRPLLDITRADILQYAQTSKLDVVEDESNQDCHFSRNYIRHQVLPALEARWPAAVHQIRRSQVWCQESVLLSRDLAQLDLKAVGCTLSPARISALDCQTLLSLPLYRAKNLVRYWLQLQSIDELRSQFWTELWAGLQSSLVRDDQQLQLTLDFGRAVYLGMAYSKLFVFVDQQQLAAQQDAADTELLTDKRIQFAAHDSLARYFGVHLSEPDVVDAKQYPSRLELPLPTQLETAVAESCSWRLGKSFEKVKLSTKPYAMTLKKLWSEWQIPLPLRFRWPLLVNQQDQIIYVPGVAANFDNTLV